MAKNQIRIKKKKKQKAQKSVLLWGRFALEGKSPKGSALKRAFNNTATNNSGNQEPPPNPAIPPNQQPHSPNNQTKWNKK